MQKVMSHANDFYVCEVVQGPRDGASEFVEAEMNPKRFGKVKAILPGSSPHRSLEAKAK